MRFINKLSIIILATFLFPSTTNAQTLSPFTFNNGGGYSNTLDWSIGESVSIAHFTSFGYSLNTGVLQPTTPITTVIEEYGPAVFGNQIIMGLDDPYPLGEMESEAQSSYPGKLLDLAKERDIIDQNQYDDIWEDNVLRWLFGNDQKKINDLTQKILG